MPWYWMLSWTLVSLILLFGVPTLVAVPFWHLYRKAKGGFTKPLSSDFDSYSHYLVLRGLVTTTAFYGSAMLILAMCSAAAAITARMPGAEVRISTIPRLAGTYKKTARNELPQEKRAHLGKDDVLFVSSVPDQRGNTLVLRISSDSLKERLASATSLTIIEVRVVKRLPAESLRWLGPETRFEFLVRDSDGKQKVVTGVQTWTSFKT